MENIEEEVIEFFRIYYKNFVIIDKNFVINPPNLLMDEAIIIIEEFIKKFNIVNGYMDLSIYFNPLLNPLIILWNFISLKEQKSYEKPKITIQHMINVAKKQEWFDPPFS